MSSLQANGALSPIRKTPPWYVFWRFFCVAVLVAWNVPGFRGAARARYAGPPAEMLAVLALFIPVLFMIFNLGAFKFPYSIFGPYRRTASPSEAPVYEVNASWGRIGQTYASIPLVSYAVFPSGLEVSMAGVGRGFLPFSYVDDIRPGFLGRLRLLHHSPEIRSPIALPTRELVEALEQHRSRFAAQPKA